VKYRVNEIFHSVQGEGVHTGITATFIRLQVCTVGCPWCDTKYTWKGGGELMETENIVKQIDTNSRLVVITGGEPTIWNLDELILTIAAEHPGKSVHLETSGQNELKGEVTPDWITWSPKRNLSFSTHASIIKGLSEVKFVVDKELTLEEVWDCLDPVFKYWSALSAPHWPYIVFMPEGCPPSDQSMQKAYQFAQAVSSLTTRPVRIMDRLQYRLGVR